MRTEPITKRGDIRGHDAPENIGVPQSRWREVLAGGLYHSGVLRVLRSVSRAYELRVDSGRKLPCWRRVSTSKFVILCYHHVGIQGNPLFNGLPPEVFDAQMQFLRRRYRIVSLDELCRELENPTGRQQAVAITFDDGYRDLYKYAFPILRKYQLPATIFLTVGSIETGQVPWYDRVFLALRLFPAGQVELVLDRPRHFSLATQVARRQAAIEIIQCLRRLPDRRRQEGCAELEKQVALPQEELEGRMLSWEQIRTMHRAGISFGSHTMTHPAVSRLAPVEMERELLESRQILEQRLGGPVPDFAFPFGQPADCANVAPALLARCGYRLAATTVWGVNTPGVNPYGLRRVQIGEERNLAMFAFKLSQLFLRAENEDAAPGSLAFSPSTEGALHGSGPLAT